MRGVAMAVVVLLAACGGGGRTTADGTAGTAAEAGPADTGADDEADTAAATDWGPLAVVAGPPNTEEALVEGTLAVEDGCVTVRESGALLVWPAEATMWDDEAGVVVYQPSDREARLADGDPIALGGGFRDRAGADWVAEPDPACGDGEGAFFVGGLGEPERHDDAPTDGPSDETSGASADGAPADPPVTAEELTAAPWVRAGDRSGGVVSLGFDPTGRLLLVDGHCADLVTWRLEGDRLGTDRPQGPVAPVACARSGAGDGEVGEAVGEAREVGRPAGEPDRIELRGGGHVTAFERVDRIGRVPAEADLVGTWTVDDATVTFAADGSVVLAADGCWYPSTWVLDDGRLRIHHGAEPWDEACAQELRRTADDPLDGVSTVRVEDGALLLGSMTIVRQLVR